MPAPRIRVNHPGLQRCFDALTKYIDSLGLGGVSGGVEVLGGTGMMTSYPSGRTAVITPHDQNNDSSPGSLDHPFRVSKTGNREFYVTPGACFAQGSGDHVPLESDSSSVYMNAASRWTVTGEGRVGLCVEYDAFNLWLKTYIKFFPRHPTDNYKAMNPTFTFGCATLADISFQEGGGTDGLGDITVDFQYINCSLSHSKNNFRHTWLSASTLTVGAPLQPLPFLLVTTLPASPLTGYGVIHEGQPKVWMGDSWRTL